MSVAGTPVAGVLCLAALAVAFAVGCVLLQALVPAQHTQDCLRLYLAGPGPKAAGKRRHELESSMRDRVEAIFHVKFEKVRPAWLRNPTTNRALELDMYNADLKLAFEYDGAQHTQYTPHYHGTKEYFQYRVLLDRLKDDLCEEHAVTLIRIPYTVRPGNLLSYLQGRAIANARLGELMLGAGVAL